MSTSVPTPFQGWGGRAVQSSQRVHRQQQRQENRHRQHHHQRNFHNGSPVFGSSGVEPPAYLPSPRFRPDPNFQPSSPPGPSSQQQPLRVSGASMLTRITSGEAAQFSPSNSDVLNTIATPPRHMIGNRSSKKSGGKYTPPIRNSTREQKRFLGGSGTGVGSFYESYFGGGHDSSHDYEYKNANYVHIDNDEIGEGVFRGSSLDDQANNPATYLRRRRSESDSTAEGTINGGRFRRRRRRIPCAVCRGSGDSSNPTLRKSPHSSDTKPHNEFSSAMASRSSGENYEGALWRRIARGEQSYRLWAQRSGCSGLLTEPAAIWLPVYGVLEVGVGVFLYRATREDVDESSNQCSECGGSGKVIFGMKHKGGSAGTQQYGSYNSNNAELGAVMGATTSLSATNSPNNAIAVANTNTRTHFSERRRESGVNVDNDDDNDDDDLYMMGRMS